MPYNDNPSKCTIPPIRQYDSLEETNLKADLNATKEKLHQTEAMLCAMCNEMPRSKLLEAEVHGKAKGIEHWFKEHRKKDIQRLMKGLPNNASAHELNLYNKIFS